MSSASPKKSDVLVVGDSWRGPVVARAFADQGASTRLVTLPFPNSPTPKETLVHVGNGELHDKARLIMGNAMADTIWAISRRNFELAKAHAIKEGLLLWEPQGLREPALLFDWSRCASLFPSQSDELISLDKDRASFKGAGEIKAHVTVLVGELPAPKYLTWLHDKWIPVTLSSFAFPSSIKSDVLGTFFNGGADFAFYEASGDLRLGSYRNLFNDKAVGVHEKTDPATLAGVTKFFGDKGWISSTKPTSEGLQVEALPCDGLPVVGAIPEAPNVHVLGGFNGRWQNFLFETARGLADSVVNGRPLDELFLFSTKRFV